MPHSRGQQNRHGQPKEGFPPGNDQALFQEARHLKLKKRFSQNFLVNTPALAAIVNAVDPQPGETVVEIGAGSGFLTRKLAERCDRLIAIELERQMVAHLETLLANKPQVELVASDVLKVDFASIATEPAADAPLKIVGNLPYAITTPILFYLIGEMHQAEHRWRNRFTRLVFLVQKEVAQRIAAEPGTKAYNPLSIAVQFRYEVSYGPEVPPKAFYPAPKVTSAVVTLTPRTEIPWAVDDLKRFEMVVKQAFAQRRKTVWNSLKACGELSADQLKQVFEAASVDSGQRAEALSIDDFVALANAWSRLAPRVTERAPG